MVAIRCEANWREGNDEHNYKYPIGKMGRGGSSCAEKEEKRREGTRSRDEGRKGEEPPL